MTAAEPTVREAGSDDVAAICRFGATYIRQHYTPLIGTEAADAQVRWWWNPTHIGAAVAVAGWAPDCWTPSRWYGGHGS